MEIAGYIATLLMGITLGLLGGGGSILTVPILVYLFGVTPVLATGSSLFIVGMTALFGSFSYFKRGEINFPIGVAFALPSMIGVLLSRTVLVPSLPDSILIFGILTLTKGILIMMVFACLMVFASWSMIRRKDDMKPGHAIIQPRFLGIIAQGFMVGIVAGFVGAGGGFLIVPALVLLAGLNMRVAIGTSLIIIALQSLFGFAGDLAAGTNVDWYLLISLVAVAAFGIIFGARLANRVPEKKLKKSFGWFVLIMGTGILIEQLRHLS